MGNRWQVDQILSLIIGPLRLPLAVAVTFRYTGIMQTDCYLCLKERHIAPSKGEPSLCINCIMFLAEELVANRGKHEVPTEVVQRGFGFGQVSR